ncbi:MAG TPA: PadR family transcriptional regulator [Candidatus Limnocylindrales bacterium]|nr:PadR family transcriptional regulator [Candidatus Limnocylindrales bacterium]
MARLTPTSYAILGLLAIKPWSTYELTMQMSRAVGHVWPRAESNLYQEPHRLVAAGLATAERRLVGRRQRTEYSITAAGRAELDAWLSEPAAPTVIESETLLKVLFGNRATPEVIVGHLRAFAEQAESGEAHWREIAHDYIEGRGPFPERLHVNTLFWVLLDRWARLRADWARWAESEVATWPTGDGPRDREAVRRLLARALEDGTSLPRSTDVGDGRADG